jgi:hypothetical protein
MGMTRNAALVTIGLCMALAAAAPARADIRTHVRVELYQGTRFDDPADYYDLYPAPAGSGYGTADVGGSFAGVSWWEHLKPIVQILNDARKFIQGDGLIDSFTTGIDAAQHVYDLIQAYSDRSGSSQIDIPLEYLNPQYSRMKLIWSVHSDDDTLEYPNISPWLANAPANPLSGFMTQIGPAGSWGLRDYTVTYAIDLNSAWRDLRGRAVVIPFAFGARETRQPLQRLSTIDVVRLRLTPHREPNPVASALVTLFQGFDLASGTGVAVSSNRPWGYSPSLPNGEARGVGDPVETRTYTFNRALDGRIYFGSTQVDGMEVLLTMDSRRVFNPFRDQAECAFNGTLGRPPAAAFTATVSPTIPNWIGLDAMRRPYACEGHGEARVRIDLRKLPPGRYTFGLSTGEDGAWVGVFNFTVSITAARRPVATGGGGHRN